MLNFDFHNPTQIVFGKNRIADIGKLVPADAKVLILVGGASAEKTGTLSEVREALGARPNSTFNGIEPNPSFETVMKAVEQVREQLGKTVRLLVDQRPVQLVHQADDSRHGE